MGSREDIFRELGKRADTDRLPYIDEKGKMQVFTVAELKKKLGYPSPNTPVEPEAVRIAREARDARKKKK